MHDEVTDDAHAEVPERFVFRFARPYRPLLATFGIRPSNTEVRLGSGYLVARFGFLRLRTPIDNVAAAEVTGPYRAYRALGARLSLADGGATFGTDVHGGVCIRFRRPVPALLGARVPHPSLTVTVADPEGLVAAIEARRPQEGGS